MSMNNENFNKLRSDTPSSWKEKAYKRLSEAWVYEVEMFKNIGTSENPDMQWVKEKRFYRGEKQLTDFDLHDIPNLRRNAKLVETNFPNPH